MGPPRMTQEISIHPRQFLLYKLPHLHLTCYYPKVGTSAVPPFSGGDSLGAVKTPQKSVMQVELVIS